jgi:hypothetical protein
VERVDLGVERLLGPQAWMANASNSRSSSMPRSVNWTMTFRVAWVGVWAVVASATSVPPRRNRPGQGRLPPRPGHSVVDTCIQTLSTGVNRRQTDRRGAAGEHRGSDRRPRRRGPTRPGSTNLGQRLPAPLP